MFLFRWDQSDASSAVAKSRRDPDSSPNLVMSDNFPFREHSRGFHVFIDSSVIAWTSQAHGDVPSDESVQAL